MHPVGKFSVTKRDFNNETYYMIFSEFHFGNIIKKNVDRNIKGIILYDEGMANQHLRTFERVPVNKKLLTGTVLVSNFFLSLCSMSKIKLLLTLELI